MSLKFTKMGWCLRFLLVVGVCYPMVSTPIMPQDPSQSASILKAPEGFNPFQIEIKVLDPNTLGNLRRLQVLVTATSNVSNLYLNWGLIQDMDIIVSDEAPALPPHIPLITPSTPLEYNVHVRLTGERPHLILQAYVLGPNGERVGEIAEFFIRRDEGSLFNAPPDGQPSIVIDPEKIKIIR